MNYLKKLESLKERALIQVAINKCQVSDFRETVLCLEKPTYGDFTITPYERGEECLERWDRLIEEQCQKLTEGLTSTFKHDLQGWIHRIALEYLSYCRRQEALFGLSPYFLMDFVSIEDWSESGRLDEEKLAKRLVEDERLTVLQRYRIACVYCLVEPGKFLVATLWKLLTAKERKSLSGYKDPHHSPEKNSLVLLFSYSLNGQRDEKVTGKKGYARVYAINQAVSDGNRAAMMRCWSRLNENTRKNLAMKMAFDAFYSWLSTQHDRALYRHRYKDWRMKLVLGWSWGAESSAELCPPFYFSDLLCFFLSEMSEADQLTFFKNAFQDKLANYVLECLLDWPHQNYFLPTVRKLWGILPKHNYALCLLILASKYSKHYDPNIPQTVLYTKEDSYYDYQGLLFQLWEETPEAYKRYIFTDKAPVNHERYRHHVIDAVMGQSIYLRFTQTIPSRRKYWENVINEGQVLLRLLLSKCPIKEADENFFKCVFNEATSSKKTELIRSKSTWSLLAWKGNWPLLDWLFRECLAEEEVSTFKKQYIESECGRKLCFGMLRGKREKLLEELVDWIFQSNDEKTEFKWKMIFGDDWFAGTLEREKNVSEVERMIRFCLDSEEVSTVKKQYIESECGIQLCVALLKGNLEKLLGELIDLVFESNEEKKEFKRKLIFEVSWFGGLLGSELNLSDVERMMRFCLDSEEFEQKYKEYVENVSSFDSLMLNLCGKLPR